MNQERFTELLKLYLDETISPEQHQELMKLISEGTYDRELQESIETTMSTEEPRSDMDMSKASEILQNILRSEKRGKVIELQTSRSWKWVAAAAMLLIAVAGVWWTTKAPLQQDQILVQYEDVEPSVFSGKQFIHLPDGSTAILNENSELTYTADFGNKVREVKLKGEAYFDIAHDSSRPFKVLTGKVVTTVLGTAFNITAYPNQKEITVTVTRGRVQVGDDKRVYGLITPDQQIAVNTTTYDFVQMNTKAETATAWKSKYLILDNITMEAAAAVIAEKYNVKIIFENEALKKCEFTATFLNGEDIEQVMTVVTGVIQADFKVQPDGNIKMNGKGCD